MFEERVDLFHLYILTSRNRRLNVRETLSMLKSLCVSFLKEIVKLFLFLFRPRHSKFPPHFKGKKVVFANTANNMAALGFLLKKYEDALPMCCGSVVARKKGNAFDVKTLVYPRVNFMRYFFILYVALNRKYRVRNYQLLLKCYGLIEGYQRLLIEIQPQCIFISNDHHPSSRALILAAEKCGVKCFYIQHASVSNHFPPNRASHALLYGQYSEDIYKEIGDSSGELIQVGNHRFDNYRHHIYNKKITKKIGVAFNTRNSVEAVNSLCDMLAQYFPSENIILRGHPAEKRKFSSRFSVSPSATEASLDFLAGIDILISGSSSILLEAAAMNVHAFQVYYEEVPDFLVDYYGFIKTGVAMEVKDNKKLIADIELIFSTGQFDRRAKTALYDCSVGKPYEFDVENHIVSVVNEILQKETKRPT